MNYRTIQAWPTDRRSAEAHQADFVGQVEIHGNLVEPKSIAAVETDYGVDGKLLYAAAIVLSYPAMEELERTYAIREVTFPYFPGLLFYREGPAILDALEKLQTDVDVILVNGHGLAHPTQCGLAAQLGILFSKPAIGCARKLLVGSHRPLDEAKGSTQPIRLADKEVGLAYRSKESVKPLYISPGHKCDLPFAHAIVRQCLRGYRLPEPLRVAHLLANRYRQRAESEQKPHANRKLKGLAVR